MKPFLFSVDLEEFVPENTARDFRRTPLPQLTERYLELLRRHKMRATFFVVGEIAQQFPELIRAIDAEGHELGCHTHTHRPLPKHTCESLRDDLRRNLDAVTACTSRPVTGFRAPILSMTETTQWAYEVLEELGFRYSSSVLPASNPLFGWPSFGDQPRLIHGVQEIPVTLASFATRRVPIGAGTYFRCLPFGAIRRRFAIFGEACKPIVGYFHPYDLDSDQERVMSGGVRKNLFLNTLLYINRAKTLPRLEAILADGFQIVPYNEFISDPVSNLLHSGREPHEQNEAGGRDSVFPRSR